MNGIASLARGRTSRARAVAPLLAVTLSTGCAALRSNLPTGRLDAVVQGDRYIGSPTMAQVYVVRGANTVSPSVQMRLQPGDSIVTAAATRVILEFTAGYRVTLDEGTTLAIEASPAPAPPGGSGGGGGGGRGVGASGAMRLSLLRAPSPAESRGAHARSGDATPAVAANGVIALFLRVGRAFVERVRGTPDSIAITTPSRVVLHDAGTQFLVSVAPGGTTALTVAEGAVRIESTDPANQWPAIVRTAMQQGEYVRGVRPSPMPALTQGDVAQRTQWVRDVRRRSRVVVPRVDSMSRDQAADVLARVGLRVLPVTFHEESDIAPERIVRSTPTAGDSVAPGTYVTLYLAKARRGVSPSEPSSTGARLCVVPEIEGKMKQEADVLIRRAGLTSRPTANGGDTDIVTAQKQAKGSRVACGSAVEYNYGRSSIR